MHEAKSSRATVVADNRRTRVSTFRAAISNANNERTSRLLARAALFEHAAATRQARAAPVEHSAPPGLLERHPSIILRFRGRLERHPSSILQLRGKLDRHFSRILLLRGELEQPFRAICGSRPGSSGQMQQKAAFLEAGQATKPLASPAAEDRSKL